MGKVAGTRYEVCCGRTGSKSPPSQPEIAVAGLADNAALAEVRLKYTTFWDHEKREKDLSFFNEHI